MTQTITRIYGAHTDALSVVGELKSYAYAPYVVSGVDTDGALLSQADLVAAMMQIYILKAEAEIYARTLAQGGTLVLVHAIFGAGARATVIMDKYASIDAGIPAEKSPFMEWDDATPLSCLMQMPVLLDDDSIEAQALSMEPRLTDGRPTCALFGIPLLTSSNTSLSGAIGMPLISNNPAPLSALLKMPTLV